jgi:peptidoglycan/LPS O-acetylase OafA/YrhL
VKECLASSSFVRSPPVADRPEIITCCGLDEDQIHSAPRLIMIELMHKQQYSYYRSRSYFNSLDGLRALSILAVVWHHTEGETGGLALARLGFLGVDMFFVLSGFLIVTLLLRERDRQGDISLRGFYLRRSLRIFPAYYGLLAVLTLIYTLKPNGRTPPGFFADLPYLLTYTINWVQSASIMAIAWSLAAEEQFYLVWPPIEKWLSRRAWAVLLGILAVNQAVNFLMVDGRLAAWLSPWRVPGMCQITFTPICLGVALAHALHSPRGFRTFERLLGASWAPAAVLGVLILDLGSAPPDLTGWPRLSIQVLMAILLGSCVIRDPHWLSPVLDNSVMRRIGVVSYGIYLYHLLGLHLAGIVLRWSGLAFPYADFLITMLVSWGMAELSYRFYEKPFLRLKDALGRRWARAGVTRTESAEGAPITEVSPGDRPPVKAIGDQPLLLDNA